MKRSLSDLWVTIHCTETNLIARTTYTIWMEQIRISFYKSNTERCNETKQNPNGINNKLVYRDNIGDSYTQITDFNCTKILVSKVRLFIRYAKNHCPKTNHTLVHNRKCVCVCVCVRWQKAVKFQIHWEWCNGNPWYVDFGLHVSCLKTHNTSAIHFDIFASSLTDIRTHATAAAVANSFLLQTVSR